ncbi:MAG: hypothetical protein KDJ64_11890, partial [Nitratireductor sp.]|nr:hypothetical protein [Nitratireductor sp.]
MKTGIRHALCDDNTTARQTGGAERQAGPMRDITTGNIIADWKPEYAGKFGKETLKLRHTLHKSELFSDERLASLIEKANRTHYHVNTRASGPDGKKRRREGEFGSLSG